MKTAQILQPLRHLVGQGRGTAENDHHTGNVSSDFIVFYGGQDCLLSDDLPQDFFRVCPT
jgi:hypothetical protein